MFQDTAHLDGLSGTLAFQQKVNACNSVFIETDNVAILDKKLESEKVIPKSVNLIAGFKNRDSILFQNDLEKWRKNFNATFTLDNDEMPGFKKGMVTAFIKDLPLKEWKGEYAVVVVGPPVMMKFVGKELLACGFDEKKIWMSFERKMSCAIGKCGHCRIDEYYVCLDGPVFPYTIAKKLVD